MSFIVKILEIKFTTMSDFYIDLIISPKEYSIYKKKLNRVKDNFLFFGVAPSIYITTKLRYKKLVNSVFFKK